MKMPHSTSLLALVAAGFIVGCDKPQSPAASAPVPQAQQPQIDAADAIYVGSDIVTVDDKQPAAEALAVK